MTFALWLLMNLSIAADWGQTRYIAKHPDQYHEMNPILGDHPSTGDVNRYFIGSLALNNAVYFVLPDDWKPYYAGGVAAVQFGFVAHNHSIGIKISF